MVLLNIFVTCVNISNMPPCVKYVLKKANETLHDVKLKYITEKENGLSVWDGGMVRLEKMMNKKSHYLKTICLLSNKLCLILNQQKE